MDYLFISNTSLLTKEQYESLSPIILDNYSIPYVEAAKKRGCRVYLGINRKYANKIECTNYDVSFYNASIYRNIFSIPQIVDAYRKLNIFLLKNDIDVIHCNTPIGGLLGRICGKKNRISKIIYTAHGFHFYKGGNKFLNFIFFFVEKILASMTDAIITINEEDYLAASRFKLKRGGKVYKVHGVGIDTERIISYKIESNDIIDEKLGIEKDDFIIISTGDINKNKNQEVVLKALSFLQNKKIHYLICGVGKKQSYLQSQAIKYGINKQVHFLGYRKDVIKLLKLSDLFILSSYREGLPRSTMEAMSAGLPCIVSNIRGNRDLIINEKGGYLCNPNDYIQFAEAIGKLYSDECLRKEYGRYNQEKVKDFDVEIVKREISSIYDTVLL